MKEYAIKTTVEFTDIIKADEFDEEEYTSDFLDWLSIFNFDHKEVKTVSVIPNPCVSCGKPLATFRGEFNRLLCENCFCEWLLIEELIKGQKQGG